MVRVLFICGKNRWRSPTAEELFSERPDLDCLSAGLSRDAETPISTELVQWADLIFVMERVHKAKLKARFQARLDGKRVVCLDIPDKYRFMEPRLVKRLRTRVNPHLSPPRSDVSR